MINNILKKGKKNVHKISTVQLSSNQKAKIQPRIKKKRNSAHTLGDFEDLKNNNKIAENKKNLAHRQTSNQNSTSQLQSARQRRTV